MTRQFKSVEEDLMTRMQNLSDKKAENADKIKAAIEVQKALE